MELKQPEALRLANYFDYHGFFDSDRQAAAELRRLQALNQDLLKALKECRNAIQGGTPVEPYDSRGAGYEQTFGIAFLEYLNAAIAKAEGQ